jgi:hypothetical protein
MASESRSIAGRIAELALEALMVVFAVLVALGVEDWRDERQMHDFAERARTAVLAEAAANLDEFRTTVPDLSATLVKLDAVLKSDDLTLLEGDMSFELPDFSAAAWRAAQVSQAASYLDYDWLIEVSRVYEAYGIYARVADQIIDQMAGMIGRTPDIDRVNEIFGRLVILMDIHAQLEERLAGLLPAETP